MYNVNGFPITLSQELQGNLGTGEDETGSRKNPNAFHVNDQSGTVQPIGYPFSFPLNLPDAWNPNLPWGSSPCPSEMSTSYSNNDCYT
ncbi:hypothetical protein HHK36_007239 [Tetracentron sinense]|uniref:Uncharacterized protein n=1 Tax=Tetracentron sinense TaxID=13715 RepID=A0A834ZN07_TETSI|nr:hypothetical protein HHK36_007239 [Tetracentron sinense]